MAIAFSSREQFNWGFHDGQADVKHYWGVRTVKHGTGGAGPLPLGVQHKAYRKGYIEGVSRARAGHFEESSADAWRQQAILRDA